MPIQLRRTSSTRKASLKRGVGIAIASGIAVFAAPRAASAESAVDYRWRRVQPWSYVATPLALGTAFALRFAAPAPEADWQDGILFDDDVRDAVALDSAGARSFLQTFTDIDYVGSMAYRLVDSALIPGIVHGAWDTSLQMSMIDLEAFSFVAITIWGTQAVFGRQRPNVRRCGEPGFESCEDARNNVEANRSFYAGHPAVGMTAAGLTCTHHAYLPLYGGGAADTMACGIMVGAAVMNGFGRVMVEKHYPTDLFVGFGIGAFSGWVLPYALHYAHGTAPLSKSAASEPPRVKMLAMPMLGPDRAGMGVSGIWY